MSWNWTPSGQRKGFKRIRGFSPERIPSAQNSFSFRPAGGICPKKFCHPDRSCCFAKRSNSEVEGPVVKPSDCYLAKTQTKNEPKGLVMPTNKRNLLPTRHGRA